MAGGADDGQQLPPLRDLTRRAASFLRMARLVLTGATAAPAQLLAEEAVDGGGCDARYESVSTEEDTESGEDVGRELGPGTEAAGESEEHLLADEGGGGPRRTRGVSSEQRSLSCGVLAVTANKLRRRPATGAASRSESGVAAAEESAEPFLSRRRAVKRANDVHTLDHPFVCDRRGWEPSSPSSSLLLLSS